jgi:hypothetical protein
MVFPNRHDHPVGRVIGRKTVGRTGNLRLNSRGLFFAEGEGLAFVFWIQITDGLQGSGIFSNFGQGEIRALEKIGETGLKSVVGALVASKRLDWKRIPRSFTRGLITTEDDGNNRFLGELEGDGK